MLHICVSESLHPYSSCNAAPPSRPAMLPLPPSPHLAPLLVLRWPPPLLLTRRRVACRHCLYSYSLQRSYDSGPSAPLLSPMLMLLLLPPVRQPASYGARVSSVATVATSWRARLQREAVPLL